MWEILTHPSHRRRTSREWSWLDLTYIGGLTLNWIESDTILKMDLAYVNPKESSRLKNYQSILTIFLNNVRYFNRPHTQNWASACQPTPKTCTRHLKYEPFFSYFRPNITSYIQIHPWTSSIHISSSSAIFIPII